MSGSFRQTALASSADQPRRWEASRTSAPLRVCLRPDLVFSRIEDGQGIRWHVKDPLALKFYQFDEQEFELLRMLDGQSTIDELLTAYRRRFAPLYLSARQFLFFVSDARRKGLLLSQAEVPPAEPEEDEWPVVQRIVQWLGRLNPLFIRFPGIDPDALLDVLYPFLRWMFTRVMVGLAVLLILSAVLLVMLRFDEFLLALPDQTQWFTPRMLLGIGLALAVTKGLHELAHALTCKHFGGECHEIGFMLLVFVPCLYCNVSDSWLLARRRERMAITGVGIVVELVLAALATWGWWFAVDGPVRMALLSMMVVGSLNTLLLNGNPLMRYDGYYLLSDLVNVPNLASESSRVLGKLWRRHGLGLTDTAPQRPTERTGLLAVYGLASFVYRLFILGAILFTVHALARSYKLQVIAWLITVLTVTNLLLPMLAAALTPIVNRSQRRRIPTAHWVGGGTILLGVFAVACLAPVPMHVTAPLLLEADSAELIYVTVPGRLVDALPIGQRVQPGDRIATLDNPGLTFQRERLAAEWELARRKMAMLQSLRGEQEESAVQIPAARQAIEDLARRMATLDENLQRLSLTAPRAGRILAAPNVPEKPSQRNQLGTWTGTPLDPRNIGCYLESGVPLCLVGDESQLVARLFVAQEDVPFLEKQQRVEILLDSLGDRTFWGEIREISPVPVDQLPREMINKRAIPVDPDDASGSRPLEPVYQIRVQFDELPRGAVRRACGTARIRVEPEPILFRFWRSIRRTFHFDL